MFVFLSPIKDILEMRAINIGDIHVKLLDVLKDRDDSVLYGATACSLYLPAEEVRFTMDLDIMSTQADQLALKVHKVLSDTRIPHRIVGKGDKQVLVRIANRDVSVMDIHGVAELVPFQKFHGVCVATLDTLIQMKRAAAKARSETRKGKQDQIDLEGLLAARKKLHKGKKKEKDEKES